LAIAILFLDKRSLFYFWISDRYFIGQWAIACGSETEFLFGILGREAKTTENPVLSLWAKRRSLIG